jgi:hypothetical protein
VVTLNYGRARKRQGSASLELEGSRPLKMSKTGYTARSYEDATPKEPTQESVDFGAMAEIDDFDTKPFIEFINSPTPTEPIRPSANVTTPTLIPVVGIALIDSITERIVPDIIRIIGLRDYADEEEVEWEIRVLQTVLHSLTTLAGLFRELMSNSPLSAMHFRKMRVILGNMTLVDLDVRGSSIAVLEIRQKLKDLESLINRLKQEVM